MVATRIEHCCIAGPRNVCATPSHASGEKDLYGVAWIEEHVGCKIDGDFIAAIARVVGTRERIEVEVHGEWSFGTPAPAETHAAH